MKRRRKRRTSEHRSPSRRVEVRHFERRLDADVAFRADSAEQGERLAVAAEQHVLAVVDALAGRAVRERRRAPAQLAARFEHQHAPPGAGERGRRAQPRDAAADDHNVKRHRCTQN